MLRIDDPIRRVQTLKAVIDRGLNVAQTDALVREVLEAKPQTPKPKRTFIAKDVRLFLNTIDHAVSAMKDAGIRAVSQRTETDDYFECVVRIPKIHSSTR